MEMHADLVLGGLVLRANRASPGFPASYQWSSVMEGSLRGFPIFQISRCVEQFQQGASDTRGPVRKSCHISAARRRGCTP